MLKTIKFPCTDEGIIGILFYRFVQNAKKGRLKPDDLKFLYHHGHLHELLPYIDDIEKFNDNYVIEITDLDSLENSIHHDEMIKNLSYWMRASVRLTKRSQVSLFVDASSPSPDTEYDTE